MRRKDNPANPYKTIIVQAQKGNRKKRQDQLTRRFFNFPFRGLGG